MSEEKQIVCKRINVLGEEVGADYSEIEEGYSKSYILCSICHVEIQDNPCEHEVGKTYEIEVGEGRLVSLYQAAGTAGRGWGGSNDDKTKNERK